MILDSFIMEGLNCDGHMMTFTIMTIITACSSSSSSNPQMQSFPKQCGGRVESVYFYQSMLFLLGIQDTVQIRSDREGLLYSCFLSLLSYHGLPYITSILEQEEMEISKIAEVGVRTWIMTNAAGS